MSSAFDSPLRAGLAIAVALSVACGADPTSPQSIEVRHVEGLVGFPARLDSIRVRLEIPGMAAVIVEDERIVWSLGFGSANVEDGIAADPSTPFHLASLTKPFAATVLMQLVEQGLVRLDDPVSEYGVVLSADGVVRVRHVLTHTSEGVPGAAYKYNGSRFGSLDQVIRSASGRSFADLLVERILEPLGLKRTAPNPLQPDAFDLTGLDRGRFMDEMAAGYDLRDGEIVPVEHPAYFGTAAGLVASAEDMAAFSMAIDRGMFLSAATWDSVFTPATSNSGATLPYGLGWFIHEVGDVTLQWHYGYWTSNSSLIVRVPEKRLTFVVLANTNMLSRAYDLGRDSDVLRSEVARLFYEEYVLGSVPVPR